MRVACVPKSEKVVAGGSGKAKQVAHDVGSMQLNGQLCISSFPRVEITHWLERRARRGAKDVIHRAACGTRWAEVKDAGMVYKTSVAWV